MPRPHRRPLLSSALALGLAAGLLAATGGTASAVTPVDRALARLDTDADRPLTVRGLGKDGTVDFIGVPARAEVDHPAVTPLTPPGAAADAAIRRYGAAVGADRPGTTLQRTAVDGTVVGDLARYQQSVDGVPVLGGQVAVSLRPDGELSSVLARTSDETSVAEATVGEGDAEALARAAFVKSAGPGAGADARSEGRWLLDAGLVGGDAQAPARTVWRFEVTRGVDERRMVLVDDRTGGVLMNVDLIHHLARVVCDDENTPRDRRLAPPPCNGPTYARAEGEGANGDPDVDAAYTLAKPVSDLYAALGIDLTDLIGRPVTGVPGATKALAQTVNLCPTATPLPATCPGYKNAFWNGEQMYYGQGYAGADDVVGHEMTHGVTERTSNLFYWGQSGAINESISDIMGEIVDHRNGAESDADWRLGEDVPDFAPDGLRNLKDPTVFGDPGSTSSPYYKAPEGNTYPDSDGVHQNSGVGNKTAYLISQGTQGTPFNGRSITGIDVDAGLTKSARLWMQANQTLTSGSDYADLALVLDQSCQALLAQPATGFTTADCDAVHEATLATELRETPARNPQPADAVAACPADTTKRVLFDSESGTPTATMIGPDWSRDTMISHSAGGDWEIGNPSDAGQWSLRTVEGIALPAGQASFLWFQQWRVLEWAPGFYYDAGTVEVDDAGDAVPAVDVASLPWVNGPTDTIHAGTGNQAAGRKGFGGDSRGYLASRLDLSAFQGASVRPQFTLNTDTGGALVGWGLDDITVYTCDPVPPTTPTTPTTPTSPTTPPTIPTTPTAPVPPPAVSNATPPSIKGTARIAQTLKARGGAWSPASVSLSFQWLRSGKPVATATKAKYRLTKKDRGKRISVRVTATKTGYTAQTATSKATGKVKAKKRRR